VRVQTAGQGLMTRQSKPLVALSAQASQSGRSTAVPRLRVRGSSRLPWESLWIVWAETHVTTLQPTAVISRKRTAKLNCAIPDLAVGTGLVETSRCRSWESDVAASCLCHPEIHEAPCQMSFTHEA